MKIKKKKQKKVMKMIKKKIKNIIIEKQKLMTVI